MLHNYFRASVAVAAIAVAGSANAITADYINFDDVDYGSYANNERGIGIYHGLSWVNTSGLQPFHPNSGAFANSGAANGLLSLPSVAINSSVGPMQFSSATPFIFNSAYFSGVWNDGLSITIRGSRNNIVVDTKTFSVGTSQAAFEQFNWYNLDMVVITASGGTNAGLGGSGTYFAFDNMTINQVPEPMSVAMMACGLCIVGFVARRRLQ